MLDEIDDPNLHQWLCVCRLLMFHHPLSGADCAEWFDKGAPAPPGWNRRRSPLKDHDTFTLINALSSKGETRFDQPANADIHDARPYGSLEETEIWKIARRLAAVLNESPTLERIERSAFVGRAPLRAAIHAYTISLTAQLGTRGDAWFRWAPRAVVDAYLRFEVPGVVAAVCLASVRYKKYPSPPKNPRHVSALFRSNRGRKCINAAQGQGSGHLATASKNGRNHQQMVAS